MLRNGREVMGLTAGVQLPAGEIFSLFYSIQTVSSHQKSSGLTVIRHGLDDQLGIFS
jgi:hypothetical protein